VGYYTSGDRMMYWGKVGVSWGLLFRSGLFLVPGLVPILAAGPIVGWIIAGLEGAVTVGGVSAIGAGRLVSAFPRTAYSSTTSPGRFVCMI
jgi:hypothetical protein